MAWTELTINLRNRSSVPLSFDSVNRMRIVEIMGVRRQSAKIKTFTLRDKLCERAEAGQFVMIWIPGVDEVPMSLSTITPRGFSSITVAEVGEATKALNQRKIGETIGIRGPFGKGFVPTGGKVMIVGGGIGVSPLVPLAEKLMKTASKVTLLVGAKTRSELLFLDRLEKALSKKESEIILATDDGSYGFKGLITERAEQQLKNERFNMVYTCGPERMMYRMFLLSEQHKVPLQASLERLMRCAIGLCGSCGIGKLMVCKDGPVLTSEQLRSVKEEFGKFQLDLVGRKVRL
jgi:dihydroorotate dehydrogenase electron transfer subunit